MAKDVMGPYRLETVGGVIVDRGTCQTFVFWLFPEGNEANVNMKGVER